MGYLVLARKYRPRTFAELVGQEHVVRTLSNSISEGRLAHAFLFVGPRGIGKTSTARILAKALNCPKGPKADFNPDDDICKEIEEGRSLDVLEIDGASNRGIESIKELRESVPYAPARGKFKIYIIDEVHMLTTEAFNALLKTLEEPPAHVKFIFATTEVQKLPATILSRCQRFDLRRIPDPLICSHLQKIAEAEKIKISDEALVLLARQAEGGLRDAESALEQLVSFAGKNITLDHVLEVFGLAGPIETRALASAILAGDSTNALAKVHEFRARHRDPIRVAQDLARHFRNLLLLQIAPAEAEAELGKLEKQTLLALGNPPDQSHLLSLLEQLLESEHHLRLSLAREVALEILVLRLCEMRERVSLETILKKLAVPGAETRAESAASRPAPSPTPKATPIPAPSSAKTPFAKSPSPSAPSSVSSNKETFLNDPAIQAALKGFGGRIIDS
jgi:DNA polymerase III subunit gamma/tau